MKMSDLARRFLERGADPATVKKVAEQTMGEILEKDILIEAASPASYLMESALTAMTTVIMADQIDLRERYPSLAQSIEDLYPHMVSSDNLGRFSLPAKTEIMMILSLEEIKTRSAVDSQNTRRLVIPRDTQFRVEDLIFETNYPILVEVLSHGTVRVLYDLSITNPLDIKDGNSLDFEIIKAFPTTESTDPSEMIVVNIPVTQTNTITYYDKLNDSVVFDEHFDFSDEFCHARVYVDNGLNNWVEIDTTYSDEYYNPDKPHAVLEVSESLRVRIPHLYVTRNMIGKTIKIDIITTKGKIERVMERYEPASYAANFEDKSLNPLAEVETIRSLSLVTVFTTKILQGGSGGLTFEQVKERVINNSLGSNKNPITEVQLRNNAERMGYKLSKLLDTFSSRYFVASKDLPLPANNNISSSPLSSSMLTLVVNLRKLVEEASLWVSSTALENRPTVVIDSGCMFEETNGVLNIINSSYYSTLTDRIRSSVQRGQAVAELNSKSLFYTPFTYMIDKSRPDLDFRAYYLDNPRVERKVYVDSNPTTLLEVTSMRHGISRNRINRDDQFYELTIITRSNASIKEMDDNRLTPIIFFQPTGERSRAYMRGSFVGRTEDDEFVFSFKIKTDFLIDSTDSLLTKGSFKLLNSDDESIYRIPLKLEIDLAFFVHNHNVEGMSPSNVDGLLPNFNLTNTHAPNDFDELPLENLVGVIHEKLKLNFGERLKYLHTRAKEIKRDVVYTEFYTEDVIDTHPRNVPARDNDGRILFDIVDGKKQIAMRHRAGTPIYVMGENGEAVLKIKHKKGDPVLSSRDYAGSNDIVMDLLMLPAKFKFVDEPNTRNFIQSTLRMLVSEMDESIGLLSRPLLDNSAMTYKPLAKLGMINAIVEDNYATAIKSEQSFRVRVYLETSSYDDLVLKRTLRDNIVSIISSNITNRRISTLSLSTRIREISPDVVLSVQVTNLGGVANYNIVTIIDDEASLSVAKKLVLRADGNIAFEDDISVEFISH